MPWKYKPTKSSKLPKPQKFKPLKITTPMLATTSMNTRGYWGTVYGCTDAGYLLTIIIVKTAYLSWTWEVGISDHCSVSSSYTARLEIFSTSSAGMKLSTITVLVMYYGDNVLHDISSVNLSFSSLWSSSKEMANSSRTLACSLFISAISALVAFNFDFNYTTRY